MNFVHFVTYRTVFLQVLRDNCSIFPASSEILAVWFTTRRLIMAKISFLTFAGALFVCAGSAISGEGTEFSLISARPTLGSIDCLRPAGMMSAACPHEIALPGGLQPDANPSEIGTYRVLRLLANERLHKRFSFLKPYDPNRRFALPPGFSANMVLGYPGANMYLDLQDLSVEWRLFNSAVRPFNNEDTYAVMRFSWRW